MNIAWSTAAILALLLPGFFFVRGLGLAEKFSRDATPRSPIALLALVVLLSLLIHTAGLLAVSWLATFGVPACDFQAVLVLASGQLETRERVGLVSSAIQPNLLAIALYFSVSCGLGALAGLGLGEWGKRWTALGQALFEHHWLHTLSDKNRRNVVFALTRVDHESSRVLYVGEIERFGVRQDGRFSFITLRNASRGRLQAADGPEGPRWRPFKPNRPGVLYIDGESIENLYFEFAELPKPIVTNEQFRREALRAILELTE